MEILVLADTHLKDDFNQLPVEVKKKINKVDLVLHAGDFKTLKFYNSLKKQNKLKGVSGNIDRYNLKKKLNEKEIFELKGHKIAMIHGHQLSSITPDKLSYLFPEVDIIIFGHTHKPVNKKIKGQLFFNPGSSIQKRLQDKYSYGIIKLNKKISSQIIRF
ncbi:MAG TPA: metallophosphoesterase family protein [Halanaerobiales bacterium]|nr:metallophosphoesterase family protein [Halanaerobiales bacterium]